MIQKGPLNTRAMDDAALIITPSATKPCIVVTLRTPSDWSIDSTNSSL